MGSYTSQDGAKARNYVALNESHTVTTAESPLIGEKPNFSRVDTSYKKYSPYDIKGRNSSTGKPKPYRSALLCKSQSEGMETIKLNDRIVDSSNRPADSTITYKFSPTRYTPKNRESVESSSTLGKAETWVDNIEEYSPFEAAPITKRRNNLYLSQTT